MGKDGESKKHDPLTEVTHQRLKRAKSATSHVPEARQDQQGTRKPPTLVWLLISVSVALAAVVSGQVDCLKLHHVADSRCISLNMLNIKRVSAEVVYSAEQEPGLHGQHPGHLLKAAQPRNSMVRPAGSFQQAANGGMCSTRGRRRTSGMWSNTSTGTRQSRVGQTSSQNHVWSEAFRASTGDWTLTGHDVPPLHQLLTEKSLPTWPHAPISGA